MNTKEIRRALQGIKARSVGVYAADRIPFRIFFPAAIVANTDSSNGKLFTREYCCFCCIFKTFDNFIVKLCC